MSGNSFTAPKYTAEWCELAFWDVLRPPEAWMWEQASGGVGKVLPAHLHSPVEHS